MEHLNAPQLIKSTVVYSVLQRTVWAVVRGNFCLWLRLFPQVMNRDWNWNVVSRPEHRGVAWHFFKNNSLCSVHGSHAVSALNTSFSQILQVIVRKWKHHKLVWWPEFEADSSEPQRSESRIDALNICSRLSSNHTHNIPGPWSPQWDCHYGRGWIFKEAAPLAGIFMFLLKAAVSFGSRLIKL